MGKHNMERALRKLKKKLEKLEEKTKGPSRSRSPTVRRHTRSPRARSRSRHRSPSNRSRSRHRSPSNQSRSRHRSSRNRSQSRHWSSSVQSQSHHRSPRAHSRSRHQPSRSRSPSSFQRATTRSPRTPSVRCHTRSPSVQQPDNSHSKEPSNSQNLESPQALAKDAPEIEQDVQQQKAEHIEIDVDIISAMGAVEEEPVNGPPVHNEIVQRWTPILNKGLKKEDKVLLLKEYTPFDNIPSMVPPKLNPELSAAVPDSVKKRDTIIEYRQKNVTAALAAVGRGLECFMFYNKVDGIKKFNDAAKILCELIHNETQSRRALIMSVINKEMKDSLQGSPDEFLFGAGLTERIRTAKAVQRSAQELGTTIGKQNVQANHRTLNSRAPPQPRQQRPHFNKVKSNKPQGGGGKKPYHKRPPQQQHRNHNPRK